MKVKTEIVSDSAAVEALETVKNYCGNVTCSACVFSMGGYCQFRDSSEAPVYWHVPATCKEGKG